MFKWFLLVALVLSFASARAQEISKELGKLDPNTATSVLDEMGKKHYDQLVKEHEAQLAELAKAGVIIIKADTLINADKPVKIAFNWPVSYGQKLSDKSNLKRPPLTMTLNPAKDPGGKDAVQKWQISYKDGTAKTVADK
jgi:hypothetical protein